MAYTKDSIPATHTEFGGGPGMLDPVLREDRVHVEPYHAMWEIYATNPAHSGEDIAEVPVERS